MHHVEYEHAINYRYVFGLYELYPAVDLQIATEHGSTGVVAVLDTGAMRTVFSGEYAEAVGLELSQGTAIRLSTLAGVFVVREFPV